MVLLEDCKIARLQDWKIGKLKNWEAFKLRCFYWKIARLENCVCSEKIFLTEKPLIASKFKRCFRYFITYRSGPKIQIMSIRFFASGSLIFTKHLVPYLASERLITNS
jgi:hypothetical protein